jgi:prolyl oligopeptidase
LAKATVVVPEGEGAIEHFAPSASRLWVIDLLGGPSRLRSFPLGGGAPATIAVPPVSTVQALTVLDGDEILFNAASYIDPPAWYALSPGAAAPRRTSLVVKSPADYSAYEVVRETATSKDGTPIPINIVRKKGLKLDGNNPTLLTGYGGFGVSLTPRYNPRLLVFLEQGGVWALANLRGGGELGDAWHKAGMLTKKQNVFDDFIAAAQHLIDARYTSAKRLAIEGGSNGGLLMGAVVTQRPELFRAVVAHAGVYDMLRSESSPNGVFITTEFGTVKDAEQFRALYAYSPYHHVKDGAAYPAMLFTAGDNDPRVDPAHSRKMVARLQAATASTQPIFLRTNAATGHGMGSALSETIAEQADVYAFLFAQLGITYRPVESQHAAR